MNILKQPLFALFAVVLLTIAVAGTAAGQGRGRGGGQGNAGGPPTSNPGAGHGTQTSDPRSNGKAGDNGSDNSSGHPNAGSDHAKQVEKDRNMPDNELNRYRGISRKLGTTPEKLHSLYLTASKLNPNLTFGQFVAANTVADNLNSRYPNVTSSAILLGLQNGHSIGQTLKTLRVEPAVAKQAEKDAKRQIKELM